MANKISEDDEQLEKKLAPITIKVPPEFIIKMDELQREEKYASRSEIIRTALRDKIKEIKGRY